ncbi:MAG: hypothetical protein J5I50_06695 [Chitinophagaceae bacterium]|nr:hypothetical protein [Chitinophagaceae bacterium]
MKRQFSMLRKYSLLVIAATVVFTSCKKENSNPEPEDPETLQAISVVQGDQLTTQVFNDVFRISLGVQASDAGGQIGIGTGQGIVYRPGGSSGTEGAECFTVDVTPKVYTEWPKTVTWDFGDGCVGKDGKTRKGKIISVFSAPIIMTGATVTTTFDGYSVNNYGVSGTLVIRNSSSVIEGLSLSTTITDGRVTDMATGDWHEIDAEIDYAQTAGADTPTDLLDDNYSVTGDIDGTTSFGFTWRTETTSPLVINFGCRWFGKGVLTLHWDDNPTPATLDYGDGACDNKALLKYKEWSKVINL